jgi:hypothetical protein
MCAEKAYMPSMVNRMDLLLVEMKNVSKNIGAKFLVVVIPWYQDFISKDTRHFVHMADAIVKKRKIDYLSLWDTVKQQGINPRSLYDKKMADHFTPAGVDFVVGMVEEYIRIHTD